MICAQVDCDLETRDLAIEREAEGLLDDSRKGSE